MTDELRAEYPSVPYFDYSHDERFSRDLSLFFDSDHLNARGAKQFTPVVIADLHEAGLLAAQ
jgi:hypothetical protein